MNLTNANLAEMARNVNASWRQGQDWKPPVDLGGILFFDVAGQGASNLYFWGMNTSGFREWVGERTYNDMELGKFQVAHRTFEKTDRCPRNAILDDSYGAFGDAVRMSSQMWQEMKYQLAIDVLLNNPVGFDGKTFFHAGHKYGKQTIGNLVTDAFSANAFNAAYNTAGTWKYDNGVLVRTRFTHLIHGPALRGDVAAVIKSQYLNAQFAANPNYQAVTPVEIGELCGDAKNYWFLVDNSRPIKAICRQVREEAKPFMDTRPEQVERTGYFDVLATGRAAAAGTMPHLIYAGLAPAA